MTDWENLVKEIERGNCVIFLGHSLLTDEKGNSMYTKFCDQLAEENRELIHMYYPDENLFLFKAARHRRKFTNSIDELYKKLKPDSELYQMLAEIPVSVYITVSPDNFLEKAFHKDVQVAFFNDPNKRGMDTEVSKDKPLIYHIFGSKEDSNSLLLSHDDLFSFFKKILGDQQLPTAVKNFFKEDAGGEVVFLGFSFKKWYVQLLLRLFNLSKIDNELSRIAYPDVDPSNDEKIFAIQHFQIEFTNTQIKDFVQTLHQKCKEKGILRELGAKDEVGPITTDYIEHRIEEIRKLLIDKNRLRADFEEKEMLSNDPKETLYCEKELEKLNKDIEKLREELKSLATQLEESKSSAS